METIVTHGEGTDMIIVKITGYSDLISLFKTRLCSLCNIGELPYIYLFSIFFYLCTLKGNLFLEKEYKKLMN